MYRPVWIDIDLEKYRNNLKKIQNLLPEQTSMMAVVKANAYGHGAVQIAKEAVKAGAKYLGVASLEEALELRYEDIKSPILVLGYTDQSGIDIAIRYNITLTASNVQWLEQITDKNLSGKLKIHLKIDTGMNRIGIKESEIQELSKVIVKFRNLEVEGVYTHMATADDPNKNEYVDTQYLKFIRIIKKLQEVVSPQYYHCGNSAFSIRFPDQVFNLVRVGIASYGLMPDLAMEKEVPFKMQPILSLKARLIHVKKLSKGEKVGYGSSYETNDEEWIGTLPIGYGDGYLRRNTESGEVLIQGERCPIVGRICMDQCMVRLPKELPIGEEVVIYGSDGTEHITLEDAAKKTGTINYEIACLLTKRVPRNYIG